MVHMEEWKTHDKLALCSDDYQCVQPRSIKSFVEAYLADLSTSFLIYAASTPVLVLSGQGSLLVDGTVRPSYTK